MSKARDVKKESKKQPAMNIKEKRAAKREKKLERKSHDSFG